MRRFAPIALLGLLLFSCGGSETSIDAVLASNDLEQLNDFRDELKTEEQTLFEKLEKIESAIAELDTSMSYLEITVKEIAEEPFKHYSEFQGDVTTDKNVLLYPEFAGVLTQVNVAAGQKVSKGQVLARIDDGGLSQQRASMELQVDLARTTYEKQSRLWEQNIGSEMQYLQAKTSYEAQAANLAQMERQLAKTAIRAPFSGTVDEVLTKQGSVVAPGAMPVFRLVSLDDVYVEVNVPEVHLPNLKRGAEAIIGIPVLGAEFDSEIRSMASYVNPANRTFLVQLDIKDAPAGLKPNLIAKVRINDYSVDKAILIPQSVVNENAEGREFVYTVENIEGAYGTAKRSFVELGKTSGDMVEALSGLDPGKALIIEGARSVTEGQAVEILK